MEAMSSLDPQSPLGPSVMEEEQARRIQEFWEASRARAGLGRLPAFITGAAWVTEMPPPAWSFGDSPGLADELLALVLAGEKTGTSSAAEIYQCVDEPRPVPGMLSIVLDSAGTPRALLRTTAVEEVPFDQVREDFARTEGEGDRTLASWRADHEAYWRRTLPPLGLEFRREMSVLCETFELLYSRG
jgi:uncharacterized protein YhfF